MECDWKKVVALDPKGYVELNNGRTVTHGPLESIQINEIGTVEIRFKWRAEIQLGVPGGLPQGNWKAVQNDDPLVFTNLVIPFEIENTPEKGPRVRFNNTNILYINPVDGLNPARVEGLEAPQS